MRNAAAACAEICVGFLASRAIRAHTLTVPEVCSQGLHGLEGLNVCRAEAARMRLLQTALSRSLDEAPWRKEQIRSVCALE